MATSKHSTKTTFAPPASELDDAQIREVNVRYHDHAADDYDGKWGISFDELGESQVLAKLRRALGRQPGRFARSLEIGAGTGYFTLNLLRAEMIEHATCSDISPGMLKTLKANADALGLDVEAQVADAERLPFADNSFDLVIGHAVLHHIPDLPVAFAELSRVLAPGGTLLFAGEPSIVGDRLARVPKRLAARLAPAWRSLLRARARKPEEALADPAHHGGHNGAHGGAHEGGAITMSAFAPGALEGSVDVHAFAPPQLRELAESAGLEDVRVSGEELLANWFGWTNRTLEASAVPEDVPWLWRQYAYRGYLLLQSVDRALLEHALPATLFYNLMLSARKPTA